MNLGKCSIDCEAAIDPTKAIIHAKAEMDIVMTMTRLTVVGLAGRLVFVRLGKESIVSR